MQLDDKAVNLECQYQWSPPWRMPSRILLATSRRRQAVHLEFYQFIKQNNSYGCLLDVIVGDAEITVIPFIQLG